MCAQESSARITLESLGGGHKVSRTCSTSHFNSFSEERFFLRELGKILHFSVEKSHRGNKQTPVIMNLAFFTWRSMSG